MTLQRRAVKLNHFNWCCSGKVKKLTAQSGGDEPFIASPPSFFTLNYFREKGNVWCFERIFEVCLFRLKTASLLESIVSVAQDVGSLLNLHYQNSHLTDNISSKSYAQSCSLIWKNINALWRVCLHRLQRFKQVSNRLVMVDSLFWNASTLTRYKMNLHRGSTERYIKHHKLILSNVG